MILGEFSRIWSDLVGSGWNRSESVGLGQIWSDLVGFGLILIVGIFGRIWSDWVVFGRIGSYLVGFGRLRSDSVGFGRSSPWEGTLLRRYSSVISSPTEFFLLQQQITFSILI